MPEHAPLSGDTQAVLRALSNSGTVLDIRRRLDVYQGLALTCPEIEAALKSLVEQGYVNAPQSGSRRFTRVPRRRAGAGQAFLGTDLLVRIEAWLAEPAPQEETANLLMDVAAAIESGLPVTQTAPALTTLSVRLQEMLSVIQQRPGITPRELQVVMTLSNGTVHTFVSRLRKAGLIRTERGRAYVPYSSHYYPVEVQP